MPTFVVDWDPRRLTARIAFGELAGATATAAAPDPIERRYALRLVKQRLHQASFRDSVLAPTTTGARSATCQTITCWTPPTSWLTPTSCSANIVNGIALSNFRHIAFDNHLIGIGPHGTGPRLGATADAA
jgi:putative restriction endonuclease